MKGERVGEGFSVDCTVGNSDTNADDVKVDASVDWEEGDSEEATSDCGCMPVEVEVGNSEDHCGGRFPTKGITEGSNVAARVGASEVHCGGFPAAGTIVGSERSMSM